MWEVSCEDRIHTSIHTVPNALHDERVYFKLLLTAVIVYVLSDNTLIAYFEVCLQPAAQIAASRRAAARIEGGGGGGALRPGA